MFLRKSCLSLWLIYYEASESAISFAVTLAKVSRQARASQLQVHPSTNTSYESEPVIASSKGRSVVVVVVVWGEGEPYLGCD
jgi:hypothetical protein